MRERYLLGPWPWPPGSPPINGSRLLSRPSSPSTARRVKRRYLSVSTHRLLFSGVFLPGQGDHLHGRQVFFYSYSPFPFLRLFPMLPAATISRRRFTSADVDIACGWTSCRPPADFTEKSAISKSPTNCVDDRHGV